jgi:hypothetical protein
MTTKINIESMPIRHRDARVYWIDFEIELTDIQADDEKKEFAEKTGEKIKLVIYNHLVTMGKQ